MREAAEQRLFQKKEQNENYLGVRTGFIFCFIQMHPLTLAPLWGLHDYQFDKYTGHRGTKSLSVMEEE